MQPPGIRSRSSERNGAALDLYCVPQQARVAWTGICGFNNLPSRSLKFAFTTRCFATNRRKEERHLRRRETRNSANVVERRRVERRSLGKESTAEMRLQPRLLLSFTHRFDSCCNHLHILPNDEAICARTIKPKLNKHNYFCPKRFRHNGHHNCSQTTGVSFSHHFTQNK